MQIIPKNRSVVTVTPAPVRGPVKAPITTAEADAPTRVWAINMFIAKREYKRYLQIGGTQETFDAIRAADKLAVFDAMEVEDLVDVVLIEGARDLEAMDRDITLALTRIHDDGAIFVTHCFPPNEQLFGTGWRAFVMLRERTDVDAIVGDFDGGVGLIRKVENPLPIAIGKTMQQLVLADLMQQHESWLRPQPAFVFETLADRLWHEPTVAIMVIGKSEEEIEEFKRNSPHVEQEARMVYVANPGRRHGATAVIANPFFDSATEDVVGVVHADTSFEPGAIAVFARTAVDENCVTGIVGRIKPDMPHNLGYLWCKAGGGTVNTLDSCSVFFRRTRGFRFDGATFDDFHCVVEDICLQARKKGMRSIVPNARADHAGTAVEPTWNANFWRYRDKLLAKYPGEEIHTV